MSKFKLFLVLLVVCYGGYFAWKYFGPDGKGFSLPGRNARTTSIADDPDAIESGTDAERPELPPLAQHHQDLQTVSRRIFRSLNGDKSSEVSNLKRIWAVAESDFKSGVVKEQDARILTDIIRQLNLMEEDRQLYQKRYRELNDIKASSFNEGMSAEQKRDFVEKELNRQWQNLVKVNREKLSPLFSGLSE